MNKRVGIVLSQEGIDVNNAPDYQRVLDTRWKYLEVVETLDVKMVVPAVPANSTVVTKIRRNPMGYVPFFTDSAQRSFGNASRAFVYADESDFYIKRQAFAAGIDSATLNFKINIFNLDAYEVYEAPNTRTTDRSGRSNIGVQAMISRSGITKNNASPTDYSINTKYKSLSVAKIGQATINSYVIHPGGSVASDSIHDGNDTIHINYSDPYTQNPATWFMSSGNAVKYSNLGVNEGIGGLSNDLVYYTIAVDTNNFKLALSKSNALSGNAVNIYKGPYKSQRAYFYAVNDPNDPGDIILHNTGYPPSFLFADHILDDNNETIGIGSMSNAFYGVFNVNSEYIQVSSLQAATYFKMSYVILKDPIEEPL